MRHLLIFIALTIGLFAQSTKVGGSGSTKVGGSGSTKVTAVAGPSGSQLGLTSIAANPDAWGSDITLLYRVQATGSGTLTTANLYNSSGLSADAKVAVYTSSSTTPDVSDTQVGISGTVSSNGTANWFTASMSGGAVTSGNFYWIAIFVSTAQGWTVHSPHTETLWYKTTSGYYASPPADLSGVTSSLGGFADISCYIDVL